MDPKASPIDHVSLALDAMNTRMQMTSNLQRKRAGNSLVVLSIAMTSPLHVYAYLQCTCILNVQ